MEGCIFCKIAKGEVPSEKEMETDGLIVFKDVKPRTEVHLLIVPKTHYEDMIEAPEEIWVEIAKVAKQLAKEKALEGFRLVNNSGGSAAVKHMHVHFLGNVGMEREI